MTFIKTFSQFMLDLYQAAQTVKSAQFKSWALERLRSVIAFDSAIWTQGVVIDGIPTVHDMQLLTQPAQLIADYGHWASQDVMLEVVLCNPGRCFMISDIQSPEVRHTTPMYQQFLSPDQANR